MNAVTTIDPGPVDGRTARRHRNKTAVLDAVIELFSEDNLTPGVHEVAERSGVSLRSVYRYFEDVDELVAAAIDRHVQRADTRFEMPGLGAGPTEERIPRFCANRVSFFTSVRSAYRASTIRAADHPRLAESTDARRDRLARQTTQMFAPELGAMDSERAETVCCTLDTLSQFDSLEYQYRNRACDSDRTTDFLVRAFTEILV